MTAGITTGVTGGRWRASITPYGAIVPLASDAPRLDWHIAAHDRWHSPATEATVRQRRIDGTPVTETRVRVPDGDAVQRIYSVADHGGLTVIEIANESPLPIAVAFTRDDLLSLRPPAAPIAGISLPQGSVAFPIGHRATVQVALAHTNGAGGVLPTGLPSADAVARGWLTTAEQAGRLLTPDADLNERVIASRCELALCGPPRPVDDPAGFLMAVDRLVRMGERPHSWLPEVAHAVERMAKSDAPESAFLAADRILAAAGDARARRDLAAITQRVQPDASIPDDEQQLVYPRRDRAELLPAGVPASWAGQNFEVFGLPASGTGTISFAIRWHGDRPAVLWEQSPGGDRPVLLRSPTLAPRWQSADLAGEALWDNYNL